MKKLLALFFGFLFITACFNDSLPENIIDKDKMFSVLLDMHLADAAYDYDGSTDSMMMKVKSRYNYIFTKNKIDSATFSKSLNYYSDHNALVLQDIYKQIVDSLEKMKIPELNLIQRYKRTIPEKYQYWFKEDTVAHNDSLKRDSLKTDSLAKKIKLDTVAKRPKIIVLDRNIKKTDSVNTDKALQIGIDF